MIHARCPRCLQPFQVTEPFSLRTALKHGYFSCPGCRQNLRCAVQTLDGPVSVQAINALDQIKLPCQVIWLSRAELQLLKASLTQIRATLEAAMTTPGVPEIAVQMQKLDRVEQALHSSLSRDTRGGTLTPEARSFFAYHLYLTLTTSRPHDTGADLPASPSPTFNYEQGVTPLIELTGKLLGQSLITRA